MSKAPVFRYGVISRSNGLTKKEYQKFSLIAAFLSDYTKNADQKFLLRNHKKSFNYNAV
tara:strand:- start:1225 stop:1401 length:177 start_codon:yes stop_codon:yes gene_type:complete